MSNGKIIDRLPGRCCESRGLKPPQLFIAFHHGFEGIKQNDAFKALSRKI
jgi:hypothetical protein